MLVLAITEEMASGISMRVGDSGLVALFGLVSIICSLISLMQMKGLKQQQINDHIPLYWSSENIQTA